MYKKWIMPVIDPTQAEKTARAANVTPLAARILCARGYGCGEALEKFINKNSGEFHDPLLLSGMKEAVEAIKDAAAGGVKIAVYGDYDVDGITSTYIVYDYLTSIGADAVYYIPDRETEGYGINLGAIDSLKERGVGLVVTVDVGITAIEQVEYALSQGVKFVITDHHNLQGNIPKAAAVINPKIEGYPFDALAGAGVALKLVYALSGCDRAIFDKYCAEAAIGTIADMVPLKGENRYLASCGLERLKTPKNTGIAALMDIAGISANKVTSSDIGFLLAPRINAAGRMSSAMLSLELLLEKNYSKALEKAQALDDCNRLRQEEEHAVLAEAMEIIENNSYNNDSFILVAKENWAQGVIGIVSSKITEMFYKPSAVVSLNPDGSGKASGRSIKGVSLFGALSACKDDLEKFGGHELAAGFTVHDDMIDTLRRDMNKCIEPLLTDDVAVPTLSIDALLTEDDITVEAAESLKIFDPCGLGNPTPLLCAQNVRIKSIRYSTNGRHAFLTVAMGGKTLELAAFSMADTVKNFGVGSIISAVGSLTVNTFRDTLTPQLNVRDIHPGSGAAPVTRAQLGLIFKALRERIRSGNCSLFKTTLVPSGGAEDFAAFSKAQIATAIKIFEELKILDINMTDSMLTITRGVNFESKNLLSDSKTYNKYCM